MKAPILIFSPHHCREAGGTGGLHGLCLCMKPDGHVKSPCALVNLKRSERNGAFGLDAREGNRGADQRTEQKAQWSGGVLNSAMAHRRGSQVCGFPEGETGERPQSWRRGNFESGNSKGNPFGAGLGRREARSVSLLGVSEAVSDWSVWVHQPT
jgi:hypothetical protein